MMLAGCWLMAASAAAENVTASDPVALAAVLREFGYPAEMGVDTQGDPKIVSNAGGEDLTVLFYGCTDGKGCNRIVLQSVWLSDKFTLKDADDWNGIGIYGQVALGDGNPALSIMINLSAGGVDKDNFKDSMERWSRAVEKFSETVAAK